MHLALTVTRLRRALQKIADLPPIGRISVRRPPHPLRARRIAIAALKSTLKE